MNVNIPPPPLIVAKPYNTTVNAEAFQPAAAAALQSAGVTQTQTLQAPSAVNRGESTTSDRQQHANCPERRFKRPDVGKQIARTRQAGGYQGLNCPAIKA